MCIVCAHPKGKKALYKLDHIVPALIINDENQIYSIQGHILIISPPKLRKVESISTNSSICIAAFHKMKTPVLSLRELFRKVLTIKKSWMKKPLLLLLVLTLAPFIMKLINSAFCNNLILSKKSGSQIQVFNFQIRRVLV